MKSNNILRIFAGTAAAFCLLVSCSDSGDKIYMSSPGENDLMVSTNEVELTQDISNRVVLSFAWTKSTVAISNSNMSAPDVLTTYMEVSLSSDFSSAVTRSEENSLSKAYSGAELNSLAVNLGASPSVSTPVYFRLAATTGNNIAPSYSNTVEVAVTTYTIDFTTAFIYNSSKVQTGETLYSADSDGVYRGFIGATSWNNFYVEEGDGTFWGNDGVTGTPFKISSLSSQWNCWYPEPSGCYYTVFDTNAGYWETTYLPNLTVRGDLSGEMTFTRSTATWTLTFTATAATTLDITLGTTSAQHYDYETGDTSFNVEDFYFATDGTNLVISSQAETIAVTVPQAGEYTLTVNLSNPKAWTCEAVSGSVDPGPTVYTKLYLPGIDDGISGSWTFDNYISLYYEDILAYAGVVNVNSQWGYQIAIEADNWTDVYKTDSTDPYSGNLAFDAANNIPAPAAGLYLIEVSLSAMTYELTSMGSQIYVLGLNNSWAFDTPLTATGTAGVYSGSITITTVSDWGFYLSIAYDDWNHKFGGYDGQLFYTGNNITDDATLGAGTYTMTVDLINQTYTIN